MFWLKTQWEQIRGNAKWEALKAAMLAAIYPLFQMARHLRWDWFVFGGIFLVALVVLALAPRNRRELSRSQIEPLPPAATPTTDWDEILRVSYHSEFQAGLENGIQFYARQRHPDSPEKFYLEMISAVGVAFYYDSIWWRIYKSQLLALRDLNRAGRLPLATVREHYERAASQYPANYAKYPFEGWLLFLLNGGLLLRHPSDMVEITTRGKDFLKYLVHKGSEDSQRTF